MRVCVRVCLDQLYFIWLLYVIFFAFLYLAFYLM